MKRKALTPLLCVLAAAAFGALPAPAGIPRYPGTPGPLVSLVFPVVRDTYVELHYAPVLRVGEEGVFLTTAEAIRFLPAKPVSLTVLNPNNVAQRDARIVARDPETGLVALKAAFPGPVYRLGGTGPREGEAVVLSGSPPRRMRHMIAPDHRVPDLRPLRTRGRVSSNREIRPAGGSPVASAWAVLTDPRVTDPRGIDDARRTLLGIVSTSRGAAVTFVSADRIRKFLEKAGLSIP